MNNYIKITPQQGDGDSKTKFPNKPFKLVRFDYGRMQKQENMPILHNCMF